MQPCDDCPVSVTLSVIGGKWRPLILFHVKDGPRRFNELRRLMPAITQRMLTLELRALEEAGIVTRHVAALVPPHVEYALSGRGRSLGPILEAMAAWGRENGPGLALPVAAA